MPAWNQTVFLLLNASGHPGARLVSSVILLAESPLVIAPLVLACLWIWGLPSRRGGLIAVAAAMIAGQGLNQLLGLLWFEPRPFMVPIGQSLMVHAADNGFPSDHATFVWALGAGLILTGAARLVGWTMVVYGIAVAWSLIWLGVHFPDDIAASAVVGIVCGTIARVGQPVVEAWITPSMERIYEGALLRLHVPPAVMPRHLGR